MQSLSFFFMMSFLTRLMDHGWYPQCDNVPTVGNCTTHNPLMSAFLAPLNRRLIGELVEYPCSGIRRRRCRCRRPPFSNVFSSETARPIKAKFYVEPPWEGGTKVCINGPGHMTKMAAIFMVKTLKNLLLQNRLADFHETWYVPS